MATSTLDSPSLAASPVPATVINPWFIAITVTIATFMELLDTSIANVSLPHIAGGLATSYDESTWVLTSYLVANAVVLPLSAWLSRVFGRKRYYMACVATLQPQLGVVRSGAEPVAPDRLPRAPGHRRRRIGTGRTGHPGRHLSGCETRGRFRALQHGDRDRPGDRADSRRLDHRQLLVALDLLHQPAARRPVPVPDQPPRLGSSCVQRRSRAAPPVGTPQGRLSSASCWWRWALRVWKWSSIAASRRTGSRARLS